MAKGMVTDTSRGAPAEASAGAPAEAVPVEIAHVFAELAARPFARIGDDRDLVRDLVVEVARARREAQPLTCLLLSPRREGAPLNPAATGASTLAVQATLRASDRLYLLGSEALVALLPGCEQSGADATVIRIRRVLQDPGAFEVGTATLRTRSDGRTGWELFVDAWRRAQQGAG